MSQTRTYPARTYLDWNASAPLRPEARAAMIAALDLSGNPSSVHGEGRAARCIVEDAREAVAALVGARPPDVIFTSSASEANATVMAAGWETILVSGIEHDSVLAPARAAGCRLLEIPVGADGVVRAAALTDVAGRHASPSTALLSLQLANNETGVLQPVAELAALARGHQLRVHTDATQAVGRIAVNFVALGVDYLTLSSHKLGGPKGAGALLVRGDVPFAALIAGGGQERRRRAGTENVAAIAGFGAAAVAARDDVARQAAVASRRDLLEAEMLRLTPDAIIIGRSVPRLPNTVCVALPGRAAETLVAAFDLAGIAVSAGAACSSGKVAESHVLKAMGLAPGIARAAIRISIGTLTSDNDVASFLGAWNDITRAVRKAA